MRITSVFGFFLLLHISCNVRLHNFVLSLLVLWPRVVQGVGTYLISKGSFCFVFLYKFLNRCSHFACVALGKMLFCCQLSHFLYVRCGAILRLCNIQ